MAQNALRGVPEDLSFLNNLEYLDISRNPITGLDTVMRGLLSLPNLRHLYIDLPFELDEDSIIVSLQNLESFNGTSLTENGEDDQAVVRSPVNRPPAAQPSRQLGPTSSAAAFNPASAPQVRPASHSLSSHGASEVSVDALRARYGTAALAPVNQRTQAEWGSGDMEDVRQLYNAANQVAGRTASPGEFERYIGNVVNHLTTILSGEEDPFAREAEVLKAKQLLYQYCFEEITKNTYNIDTGIAGILGTVYRTYTGILEAYKDLVHNLFDDREQKMAVMRNDMQYAIQEIEQLMQNMDTRSEAAHHDQLMEEWTKEKAGLVEEIGWLRTENERLQTKMRQFELTRQKLSTQLKDQQSYERLAPTSARTSPRTAALLHSTSAQTDSSSVYDSGGVVESPHTFVSPVLMQQTSGSQSPVGRSVRQRPVPGRSLSLRQLKEVIEDIYTSKSKFDIKCAESHLPRETMEQHLYTYLNQKYGLKNLILDWAESIIAAIRRYTPEDNDVAVFGKILRNEVDEEFRFVQRQLKETVADLLRVYLRGKFPAKTDEEINQLLRKRTNGFVNEEEWVDIVKYMYNADDAMNVIVKVREAAVDPNVPPKKISARRVDTEPRRQAVIHYSDFVKVLLDFQLSGHDRFLAKFVKLFRQYDTDKNGIVNENEFRALLRAIDPNKTEDEMNQLLDLIDPHNNQLITFSECVTFLSSELVALMRERQSS